MHVVDGGPLTVRNETPIQLLWRMADEHPDGGGYWFRDSADAPWTQWSWPDVRRQVSRLAAGLQEAGMGPGDRVAIWSDTRVEWRLIDQAVLAVGATVVPVYPTLAPDQVAHILGDANCKGLVVERQALLDTLPLGASDGATVWLMEAPTDSSDATATATLDELRAAGDGRLAAHPTCIDEAVVASDPSAGCTIIYTSGTTGTPKGAMLTNQNWSASTQANVAGLGLDGIRDPSIVMFLPLAHVAGYAASLAVTALGGTLAWSHPTRFAADLQSVRPTLMMGVPRIFERIIARVEEAVGDAPRVRQFLWHRARRCASEMGRALEDGGQPGLGLRLRHALWDRLVGTKLRARLGFDRVQLGLIGAAAVRPDLLYLLQGLRLGIVEAYGLTESTGMVTSNPFHSYRAGSVGIPMPGVAVGLGDEEEVLLAGPAVFGGYLNLEAETSEAFVERDGRRWLRTGDVGRIDADGYLHIVDRIKELEVLDTGKMVAPLRVEEMLKGSSPLVEDAVLIGTGKKYVAALIQPAYDALLQWARKEGIAEASGDARDDPETVRLVDPTGEERTYGLGPRLLEHPRIRKAYEDAVEACNARLADFERIKRFDLVPHAFTVDRGELTPTFKKRRKIILSNHGPRIDALFA